MSISEIGLVKIKSLKQPPTIKKEGKIGTIWGKSFED